MSEPQEVGTEAQLAELNRMSDQLKANLEGMIEEQRARVEAFTASQHSLSSLPSMPQLQQQPAPQLQQTGRQQPRTGFPTPAKPRSVTQPPPLSTRQQPAATPTPPPLPPQFHRPSPRNSTAPGDKEEAGSYGWVITVIIFLVIIILRNCD